jgi:hypothetical protein
MHMIGRRRIVRRVLGAVGLAIAAAATVFAMGTAHAASAHHSLADDGVINSKN